MAPPHPPVLLSPVAVCSSTMLTSPTPLPSITGSTSSSPTRRIQYYQAGSSEMLRSTSHPHGETFFHIPSGSYGINFGTALTVAPHEFVTPVIDRSIFNKSVGSRCQIYSRHATSASPSTISLVAAADHHHNCVPTFKPHQSPAFSSNPQRRQRCRLSSESLPD